jgi:beta-glucosidase
VADFPPGFLWGAATSAHQVEGGNTNNDWWDWEHQPGSQAVEPSGDAIDQFHRYDADFALLGSLGHNAHRMSIEWSRVEPAPGEFSSSAIDHYRRVLESMHSHGLTPFVTLLHKTLPRWFAADGGWLRADALDRFGGYVNTIGERVGDLIDYACTINEPQILPLFGYLTAQFPPAVSDVALAGQVNTILIEAHRRAVVALRAGRGQPQIGTCLQLVPMEPLDTNNQRDNDVAAFLNTLMIDDHINDLRAGGDVGDWVGLQYYTRVRIDTTTPTLIAPPPPASETTEMGWEVYPPGFGAMLRRLATAGLPIVVTENGIATTDDDQRIRFLASHLRELKAGMDEGINVRGYLHWSAFDNFEWNHGFRPTFGLVGIDRGDGLRRVPRPSAYAYERVIRTGLLAALDPEPVAP